MKKIMKWGCGSMAVMTLIACNGPRIEGVWVESVPGMEEMMQGVCLESGGRASSVNMATLRYESWERIGDKLILSGKSVGNGQTIDFSDTLIIEKITPDSLSLRRGDSKIDYSRQK